MTKKDGGRERERAWEQRTKRRFEETFQMNPIQRNASFVQSINKIELKVKSRVIKR